MTTIQDRIISKFTIQFSSVIKNISVGQYDENGVNIGFIKAKDLIKQFLLTSIKEVEEETRKEIINHIDFFADQSRWFVDEDNGVGPIIQTRVISVEDLQKELLSITNKEKQ